MLNGLGEEILKLFLTVITIGIGCFGLGFVLGAWLF